MRYYRLEEFATSLADNERDALFARWITYLGRVTGPIRKAGVEELLGAIPELPRAWVETTDTQLRARSYQMERSKRSSRTTVDGLRVSRRPGIWCATLASETTGQ